MARLTLISIGGWAVILCLAVGAIWLPAVLVSERALVDAREDQLNGNLLAVRNHVLVVFQEASRLADLLEKLFDASLTASPLNATHYFFEHYGEVVWYTIQREPIIARGWVSQLRLNSSGKDCDIDAAIITEKLVADIRPETSGDTVLNCANGTHGACNGGFRMSIPAGSSNTSYPLKPIAPGVPDQPCSAGMASTKVLWKEQRNETWHGYRNATWGDVIPEHGTIEVVRPTAKGPKWAPQSGLCGVMMHLAPCTAQLNSILAHATLRTELEETLFLMSRGGRLLASSLKDGPRELFPLASDPTLLPPAVTVAASQLISTYCTGEKCSWKGVPPSPFNTGGYTILAVPVEDELAADLGMALVITVKMDEIREPAEEINISLAIIAPLVLCLSCLVAFGFSLAIARPIHSFTRIIQDAAEMKDLECIMKEQNRWSLITEIACMRKALGQLVSSMSEYKTFLPPAIFEERSTEEDANTQFSNVLTTDSCEGSSTQSRPSQLTGVASIGSRERTLCALSRHRCAVMAINLAHWSHHAQAVTPEQLTKELFAYVSLVKDSVSQKGTLDRFNGDRVLLSWNTTTTTVGYRRAACQAAHSIRVGTVENDWLKCPMGIGISGGSVLSGNAGSDVLRSFNVVGVAVNHAIALSEIAAAHASKLVVLASEFIVEVGHNFAMPITGLISLPKLDKQGITYRKVVHEVLDPLISNSDWLYTVGEQAIPKIIEIFEAIQGDQQVIPVVKEELMDLLFSIRRGMVFADSGWADHIRTLKDDNMAIIHVK